MIAVLHISLMPPPKKILFTESSPNLGGQELQLLQQMRLLNARGFECTLVCRPGSRVGAVAAEEGLSFFHAPFRNSVHPATLLKLVAWMHRNRPVAAICHSGHDANNLAVAARFLWRRPKLIRSKTYVAGRPRAFSHNVLVDATIVPSEYLRSRVLENAAVRPSGVEVLYPTIDFDRLAREAGAGEVPAEVDAWIRSSEGPLMVHASMLRPEKGHLTVIRAMARLSSSWPDLRLIIAGEGVERETILAAVREAGLERRILLAGLVSSVAPLLRRADLVLMPSLHEPLGMVQIEALSLGVPVVASDVGGIPETVRHERTGVLVAPGDVEAWASALDRALASPEGQRRLAESGRDDVLARFSSESHARRLIQLIES